MSELRFVIDTNVAISAVLMPRSIARRVFDLAFAQGDVLASVATIEELEDVLRRPKFERYVSEERRMQFLAAFIRDVILIKPTTTITDCRDPKDNKFLELAVDGRADYLVSGDKDLLSSTLSAAFPSATPLTLLRNWPNSRLTFLSPTQSESPAADPSPQKIFKA